MIPLLNTLMFALNIYIWILIANAIFSWLFAFNVINTRNQFVNTVGRALYQMTEPVLRPIRRFMPASQSSGVRSVGNRHRPSGVTYAITAVCSPAVAARQSAA